MTAKSRLTFLLGFAAAAAVIVLRKPSILINPQLWAEDASIFLIDGIQLPYLESLLAPYAGYIVALPRLVAGCFTYFNLYSAPLVFNVVSLLVFSFSVSILLTDLLEKYLPLSYRIGVFLFICLMPWHTETLGTITNTGWYLSFAVAVAAIGDHSRLGITSRISLCALLLITVFTSPNTLLLLPVFLLVIASTIKKRDFTFCFASLGALLILSNILITLLILKSSSGFHTEITGFFPYFSKALGFKVGALTLFGGKLSFAVLTNVILYTTICAGLAVLFCFMLYTVFKSRTHVLYHVSVVYFIVSPLLLLYLFRPDVVERIASEGTFHFSERYFILPSFFLVLLIANLLHVKRILPRFRKWEKRIAVAVVCVIVAVNFRYEAQRDFEWKKHIYFYYQKLSSTKAPGDAPFDVPILPGRKWTMSLPLFTLDEVEKEMVRRQMDAWKEEDFTEHPDISKYWLRK